MAEEKTKTIPVRLPPELRKQAKRKMADDDTSFQQLFIALLTDWVGGTREVDVSTPTGAKFAADLRRLEAILEKGTPSERDTVRAVIRGMADTVESRNQNTTLKSKRA